MPAFKAMNRIDATLSGLRRQQRKALTLFLTAGYPQLRSTVRLALNLQEAGADMIELGMPFSDPIADGSVIQECSAIALRNGVTLDHMFSLTREIRKHSDIPIILMGYINPILNYSPERFFGSAAEAGVDGVILPELPLEEVSVFRNEISASSLSHILLISPLTPGERVRAIDAASTGFVYCVSTTGVTGAMPGHHSLQYVRSARSLVRQNPFLVGFGIATPADARAYASESDGIIVGSALLRRLMKGEPESETFGWVRGIRTAIAG